MCDISVVVPIYNEWDTIPELVRRTTAVLSSMHADFEIVFVNDGSRDGSLETLRQFALSDLRIRIVDLSRNFGHQAALCAGLRRARGRAVVLMDGDLQDPPEVIPRLVAAWKEGSDVVYAVRTRRKEGWLKRAAYAGFYRLLRGVAYVDIPVDSGDFSLLDEKVARILGEMPERNKFLRGLRSWVGFRQERVLYERDARFAGTPKYTLSKLVRLALDGILAYSFVPLRLSLLLGLFVSGCSFLLAITYLALRIFSASSIPQGFTTIAVLVLFLGGMQLMAFGIMGEYIGRIYDEVKQRPEFIERELVGFAAPAAELVELAPAPRSGALAVRGLE